MKDADIAARLLAFIIDYVISYLLVSTVIASLVFKAIKNDDLLSMVIATGALILTYIGFFAFAQIYGGSFGKRLCRLKVVNQSNKNISIWVRFKRSILYFLLFLFLLGGLLHAMITVPDYSDVIKYAPRNLIRLLSDYGGVFDTGFRLSFLLILIDFSAAAFIVKEDNQVRRLIHDFFADARVVKEPEKIKFKKLF